MFSSLHACLMGMANRQLCSTPAHFFLTPALYVLTHTDRQQQQPLASSVALQLLPKEGRLRPDQCPSNHRKLVAVSCHNILPLFVHTSSWNAITDQPEVMCWLIYIAQPSPAQPSPPSAAQLHHHHVTRPPPCCSRHTYTPPPWQLFQATWQSSAARVG